jgi:hypothetical protein
LLEKKIRQRQSRQLSSQFIADYIGKYNPQPDPGMFRFLWQQVVPLSQQENKILPMAVELNDDLIRRIQQNYSGYLDKALINYKDGSFSLAAYFTAVRQMPYGNRPRFTSAGQLANQLGNWVRDELLLDEAKKRNLERNPRVLAEVRSVLQQQFYDLFVEQEIMSMLIPDSIQAYFKLTSRAHGGMNKTLSRFHTLQEWCRVEAEKNLQDTLRTRQPRVWIDRDKIWQEAGNINWDRHIRMFMVRR